MSRLKPALSAWRSLLLLLALLCVVVKPVVGLAGELHRDLHGSEEMAASLTTTDAADDDQRVSGLHELLHVDLCCGNALIPTELSLLPIRLASSAPDVDTDWLALAPPLASALRPPIRL